MVLDDFTHMWDIKLKAKQMNKPEKQTNKNSQTQTTVVTRRTVGEEGSNGGKIYGNRRFGFRWWAGNAITQMLCESFVLLNPT